MKRRIAPALLAVLCIGLLGLCGCGGGKPEIEDDVTKLKELPTATQVALVLRGPLWVLAFAACFIGMRDVKIINVAKKDK